MCRMCAGGSRALRARGVVGEVAGKRGGVSADRRAAKGRGERRGERARGDGEAQEGRGRVTRPHRLKGGGVPGVERWGRVHKARKRTQVLEKYVKKMCGIWRKTWDTCTPSFSATYSAGALTSSHSIVQLKRGSLCPNV